MSGHSKWSKIKHQKATTDVKKGKVFSKLSRLITIAAKKGGSQETNQELKYAINQAKTVNMPSDNIARAIKKGTGEILGEKLEETRYEAFGPGGSVIAIDVITNNKNRTLNEIKQILARYDMKLAQPNSTDWAMKTQVNISLEGLINDLKNHDDIQKVRTNCNTGH